MPTFARLHHKRQARVDAVGCLLRFLWGHRCALRCSVEFNRVCALRRIEEIVVAESRTSIEISGNLEIECMVGVEILAHVMQGDTVKYV